MSDLNSVSVTTANTLTGGVTLPNEVLEHLYQSYSLKQKRAGLNCFLAASILFDLWAILIPQGQSWESIAVLCIFLALNLLLGGFLRLCGNSKFHTIKIATWEIAPHAAWLIAIKQLFLELFFRGTVTPRSSLGWAVLLNFLVYITLPVFLKYIGLLFGLGSFTIYISAIIGLAKKENYFWEQQFANVILILTAATIGLLCYFLGEAKQRRAFLEAKQSLEVKMLIEEQSAEQERLLLSVLPEHVAVKMREDLGLNSSEQFKKIYMSRHENVSILYADIVGFTAISSTYSAQELVKILNELFARFDRLAEKYQQLRIKILGDCYYCISGAPVERPDHAVLCVHMGLSMVKAIRYVQQKTNSPVDMRVGIHTGAILAGILGQRQWQFDIYSKDVELANKMESSGMAGRVHISEKTLGFLNGEFEVERAYGEKREESLRIAGLKTYFITKVLVPFSGDKQNGEKNGKAITDVNKTDIESDGPSEILKDEMDSKCTSPGAKDGDIIDIELSYDEASENFKQRLRKELVARDGHEELSKNITFFLTFNDKNIEAAYSKHREPLSSVPLVASLLVQLIGVIYTFLVLPRTLIHFAVIGIPLIVIAVIVIISIAESFPNHFPPPLPELSQKFNDFVWLRKITAILVVVLLGISNAFDMFASSLQTPANLNIVNASLLSTEMQPSIICLFPSYYSNFAVLILISTAIITQLSHLSKIFLMGLITGVHCYMNIFPLEEPFRFEDPESINVESPLRIKLSALLMAVTIALCIFTRHIDRADRVIFMWKTEVSDQKEKAADMRRRNEALVYNVLPVHVAEHFMRNKKRSYDELYSQSYAEVGVLFASMPNFSDFYSEESVNNQGLECLRFLNEVISDFDALLELPQFHDVIKIKTIGSTYMAASGLNPTTEFKHDDHITLRWAHLENLVDFALELKRALQGINEQSFNHFVLKMGINHGPITAGVIGARKPHYDIWGNTVNVASRMESTGKAGAIQVTQETCKILEKFGYTFIQRGLVNVKGKGELLTFYLQGKGPKPPSTPPKALSPVSPTLKTDTAATDSPFHLQTTTTSSSTASPNSVRLNQDYQDDQKVTHQLTSNENAIQLTNNGTGDGGDVSSTKILHNTSTSLIGNINNCNNNNGNSGNNGIILDNSDVIMPLLLPNNRENNDIINDVVEMHNSTNSNNLNSNHVVSEKEALLQDAN